MADREVYVEVICQLNVFFVLHIIYHSITFGLPMLQVLTACRNFYYINRSGHCKCQFVF
jgi:hypothetical protein